MLFGTSTLVLIGINDKLHMVKCRGFFGCKCILISTSSIILDALHTQINLTHMELKVKPVSNQQSKKPVCLLYLSKEVIVVVCELWMCAV